MAKQKGRNFSLQLLREMLGHFLSSGELEKELSAMGFRKERQASSSSDQHGDSWGDTFSRLLDGGHLDSSLRQAGWSQQKAQKDRGAAPSKGAGVQFVPGGNLGIGEVRAQEVQPEDHGWKVQGRRKEKKPAEKAPDSLDAEGWTVPILSGVGAIKSSSSGVLMATAKETKQLLSEFRAAEPLGLLCTVQCDPAAEEVQVATVDACGKRTLRRKYLHQVGPIDEDPVRFTPDLPKVQIRTDTQRLVITYLSSCIDSVTFKTVMSHPHQAARKWLQLRASVEMLDVCGRPTCSEINGISQVQVIVRIPSKDLNTCLAASGIDGVWSREFVVDGQEHLPVRVVRLEDADLKSAVRQAARIDGHLGVVKTRQGFGIRVESSDFEATVKLLCPSRSNRILAKKFAISGLPLSCGRDALAETLQGWGHEALFTFKQDRSRTWVVAAAEAPTRSRFQHQDGCALVQEYQPRPRLQRPDQQRKWMMPTAASAEHVEWPNIWSNGKEKVPPASASRALQSTAQPMAVSPMQLPASIPAPSDLSATIAAAMAQALRPLEDRILAMEKNRKRDMSREDAAPRGRPRIIAGK